MDTNIIMDIVPVVNDGSMVVRVSFVFSSGKVDSLSPVAGVLAEIEEFLVSTGKSADSVETTAARLSIDSVDIPMVPELKWAHILTVGVEIVTLEYSV